MMSYGKRTVELVEEKMKSWLKDDEVRVFVLSDDASEVKTVRYFHLLVTEYFCSCKENNLCSDPLRRWQYLLVSVSILAT